MRRRSADGIQDVPAAVRGRPRPDLRGGLLTTPKTFLCRCEDLTVEDCTDAIADGYTCFEDLKRFLGVGTGPCQGKSCVQAAMRLIAETEGIPVSEVDVMTFRPPVRPIPFEVLAATDEEEEDA